MCMYNMSVIHVHAGVYYYEVPNLQGVACESGKAYSGRYSGNECIVTEPEYEYIQQRQVNRTSE